MRVSFSLESVQVFPASAVRSSSLDLYLEAWNREPHRRAPTGSVCCAAPS